MYTSKGKTGVTVTYVNSHYDMDYNLISLAIV